MNPETKRVLWLSTFIFKTKNHNNLVLEILSYALQNLFTHTGHTHNTHMDTHIVELHGLSARYSHKYLPGSNILSELAEYA